MTLDYTWFSTNAHVLRKSTLVKAIAFIFPTDLISKDNGVVII